MAKIYQVLSNLNHDGTEYTAGMRSVIQMTDAQEAALIACGVIAVDGEAPAESEVAAKGKKGK